MALSIGFAEAITAAVCDLFAAATCAAQTWNPGRSPASRPRSGKTSCPVESWKDQVRWVRWVRWVRCIGCHIGWVTWDFRHFGSVWKLSHGQQIASRIFTDPLLQPGSVKGSLWTSSPICPESGCEERSEHQRNTWRGVIAGAAPKVLNLHTWRLRCQNSGTVGCTRYFGLVMEI